MTGIFTTVGADSFTTTSTDSDRAFFPVFVALHLLLLFCVLIRSKMIQRSDLESDRSSHAVISSAWCDPCSKVLNAIRLPLKRVGPWQ